MGSTKNDSIHDGDDDDDVQIIKIVEGGNPRNNHPSSEANSNTGDDDDLLSTIVEFKNRNHSLGIGASSVAACVGYNEFQSIPELMLKHVYQGRGGRRLLELDARLLGLEIATEEDDDAELLQLAQSTGSAEVLTAVTRALKVKNGDLVEQQKLRSVDDAQKLKRTVSDLEHDITTKQKLTKNQLRILKEGTRRAVDTGCGNSWEEEALDRYQEQCGWDIRERNAECRLWHFEKTDDDVIKEDVLGCSDGNYNSNKVPSIRPIAPAQARRHTDNGIFDRLHSDSRNNNNHYDSRGVKRKFPSPHDSKISEEALVNFSPPAAIDLGSALVTIEEVPNDGEEDVVPDVICVDEEDFNDISLQSHNQWPDHRSRSEFEDRHRPFVTIKGMVDGIRDELGPTTRTPDGGRNSIDENDDDDDDDDFSCGSFSFTRVVVECKHRMKALLPNGPRFSECIQAVVYCFMYEADQADIVQVLRTKTTNKNAKRKSKGDNKDKNQNEPSGPLLTDYFKKSSPGDGNGNSGSSGAVNDGKREGTNNSNNNETRSGSATTEAKRERTLTKPAFFYEKKGTIGSDIAMKIAVDRVSLDDPQFDHRANWKSFILPKLRHWVDAVYEIRRSDDKRYRLLTATSLFAANNDKLLTSVGGDLEQQQQQRRKDHSKAAWELVFEECDFLREGMSGDRYRIETQ